MSKRALTANSYLLTAGFVFFVVAICWIVDGTDAAFALACDLADRLGLPERSMGMSGDLEQAVAEGATMVRVGTALFGPRRQTGGVGK